MKAEKIQEFYNKLLTSMKAAQGKKDVFHIYYDNEYDDFFIVASEELLNLSEYKELRYCGNFSYYCGRFLCSLVPRLYIPYTNCLERDRENGVFPEYLDKYTPFIFSHSFRDECGNLC